MRPLPVGAVIPRVDGEMAEAVVFDSVWIPDRRELGLGIGRHESGPRILCLTVR